MTRKIQPATCHTGRIQVGRGTKRGWREIEFVAVTEDVVLARDIHRPGVWWFVQRDQIREIEPRKEGNECA